MIDPLARRSTVRELVAAFQAAEATVRQSFTAITEAEGALNLAFGMSDDDTSRIRVSADNCYRSRFNDPDSAIEQMARDAWSVIVDRLEVRRAMSIDRYESLQRTLRDEKLPAITEANVASFVARFSADLPTLFDEAVREVFDWLRPRRSKLKTNSEFEIPRKVILSYIVEPADKRWSRGRWRICHHTAQRLIALENVFHGLDGRGTICADHYSQIQRALEACPYEQGTRGRGETDLFEVSVFENGNGHLVFKRLDLLDRLNKIAGGKRLRSAAA